MTMPKIITFRKDHIALIQRGIKTETRRISKRNLCRKGDILAVKVSRFKPEIELYIETKEVYRERLGDIDLRSALDEGYDSIVGYFKAFAQINRQLDMPLLQFLEQEVTVIEFKKCEYIESKPNSKGLFDDD